MMPQQLAFDLYAQAPTAKSPTPADPNWRLIDPSETIEHDQFDWMQMKDGTIYVRSVSERAA